MSGIYLSPEEWEALAILDKDHAAAFLDYSNPNDETLTAIAEAEHPENLELVEDAGESQDGLPCEVEMTACDVCFDSSTREVEIDFSNGTAFIFPADKCQGLKDAPAEQLSNIEFSRTTVYWADLDVHLSIPHLMKGAFGSEEWMENLHD
jgi:hypothetical protein